MPENELERQIALALAQANFTAWLVQHPHATYEERSAAFGEMIEGGIGFAAEFREENPF